MMMMMIKSYTLTHSVTQVSSMLLCMSASLVLVCYIVMYWYLFTDSLTLHVMVEGGLIYLCAAESDFGKRQPYAFLNEVGRMWLIFLI